MDVRGMDGWIHRPALLLVLIPVCVWWATYRPSCQVFKSLLSRPEVLFLF